MRSEVLYQYDLPIELLDEIPRTEEVLEVIYARSKEKYLIPILVTRERILWAYPETSVVYRVYAMQYVDLVSVYVRFLSPPLPSVIQFTTVNKQKYTFSSLQADKQQIRALLMTISDEMHQMAGKDWVISQKKTLLNEEYWADEMVHRGAEIIGTGVCAAEGTTAGTASSDADFFEEQPLPGKGCFESNETLFSHFAAEGEDVFEEDKPAEKNTSEDSYTAADEKVARIVETVEAEISDARKEAGVEKPALKGAEDDSVIYGPNAAGITDEQWGENSGGDAMILDNPKRIVQVFASDKGKCREYGPEDDDSVLYPPVSAGASVPVRETVPVREYGPEDDDSIVYPSSSDEEVVITPMKKPAAPVAEYTLLDESRPKPAVKMERDEVILTPMKRPKPEYESVDGDAGVPVNFRQKPSDERLTDNYDVSVGLSTKPSYEVGDGAVPLPVKPLPSYEFEEARDSAPARKATPFEESNKDNIVLRNQVPDTENRTASPAPHSFPSVSADTPSGMMNPFMKAVTLEPKDEYDLESVEKVLEELKHLRDTGIITPDEYKVRSLKLFKGE
ncbi:MAG TPA: hypothetical protein O0X19_01830 [Methanocorpusculum sp.]|nr:hypothetical protein [Methanocorpusculum sp.]HJJ33109.1 hypothetical protein [Methanocorpusculum sp.]HJJ59440.1 hypothetical protein [Methanocorpusculum sp.]